MCALMVVEMVTLGKRLVTNVAFKWLLPGVSAFMSVQVSFLTE